MSHERRTDALCVLGLLAFSTLLFADVLFFGSNFYFRDLYSYHMPLKRIVYDTILRGEWPLWQRTLASGQPMAANPAYEVFYPPQWLMFAGSFEFGYALHIVAHIWLALVGMYVLLRALPLRVASSLFGALSFGLGGLLTGTATNLTTFFAWSWAPLIGWTVLRLVRAPSARRFAAATIAASMLLLIAEPFTLLQIWFMLLVAAIAYARPRLPLVVATAAGSMLVAAVQLVPMFEHVRTSSRARGFSYALVVDWSMPLVRPVELLMPRFFGRLAHGYWGGGMWGDRGSPYLLSIYADALVTILAIAGFAARVRGARVTGILALTSYVLALGGHTPLFSILYALGIRSLRYPEKFAAMGVVAMIVFAATVANRLEERDAHVQRVARIVAWILAALVGAWAVVTMLPSFPAWFVAMWDLSPRAVSFASVARTMALFAAAVALGWAAIVTAHARGHERPALLAGLLLLLIDVGTLQNEALQRLPQPFFQPPDIVKAFDRHAGAAIFHRGEWVQQAEKRSYMLMARSWLQRNALRPYVPALWGLPTTLEADFDETALIPTHDLLDAMIRFGSEGAPNWSEPFMTMSNVGYVLDYRPPGKVLAEARGNPEVWQPVSVRRVPAQGRYWFAHATIPARSQSELLAALRRTPDVRGLAFVPWPPFPPAPARITRVHETANDAELDVEATGRALLVATVTRDRHWHATLDGAPVPLPSANVAYQAIVVPPGRHRIEMHYRNGLITVGAVISVLTLLAFAAVTARSPRLRPPRTGS